MVDTKYPLKDTTKLTHIGKTYYIRVPFFLVKSGLFPVGNMIPVLMTIESEDRIVVTRVK